MKNEKIRNACAAAVQVFEKLNREEFTELKSNLEFCIGSFNFDKNPSGLIEFSKKAAKELKAFKVQHPRKVNKKIIADLEKHLSN